jgi:rRNA processing protein Gar1
MTIKLIKFLYFSNLGSFFGGGFLITLGKLLHIASSKNLILRVEIAPPLGTAVLTGDAKEIGHVVDIFGPKRAPFVSVKSPSDEAFLQSLVGRVLFYREKRRRKTEHENSESRPFRGKRGEFVG